MTNLRRPAANGEEIKQAREILKEYHPGKYNKELLHLLEELSLKEFIDKADPEGELGIHVFRAALVSMFQKRTNNYAPIR